LAQARTLSLQEKVPAQERIAEIADRMKVHEAINDGRNILARNRVTRKAQGNPEFPPLQFAQRDPIVNNMTVEEMEASGQETKTHVTYFLIRPLYRDQIVIVWSSTCPGKRFHMGI
jgi:hypothetical protein